MPKPDAVVNKIRKALESRAPVEISPGPVETTLDALDTLWLLSYFCNPAIRAGLQVTRRGEKKPRALYALPGNSRVEYSLDEFSKAAKDVQEGDVLELLCAGESDVYGTKDDLDDYGTGRSKEQISKLKQSLREAAKVRFVGTVGPNRTWRITAACPKTDAASLKDALELLAKINSETSEWARDDAEAQAVLELTRQCTDFPLRNPMQVRENTVEVRGREIFVKPHRRPLLAMMFCWHRFPNGPWDFKTHQREDAFWVRIEDQNEQRIRERMAQLAAAKPPGQSPG
ncbi:MAG TPA: hypothetical protein VJW51_13615 [Candidatus Acidoferrales bacterium]|nr:hypothetical protein [Candidatus Acidoferrales bacterium]